MTVYHSEKGLKGASNQGESYGNKEDSFMNEWFNKLNRYIENSTNNKYSLRKTNDGAKSNDKKEILFSILTLSSVISFREKEAIDKHMELKHLAKTLETKIRLQINTIKPESKNTKKNGKKEKDSRKKYTE